MVDSPEIIDFLLNLGVGAIFLYLYMKERREHNETRNSRVDDWRGFLKSIQNDGKQQTEQ